MTGGEAPKLAGEAVAEAPAHVVGGQERAALEERARLGRIGQRVEQLADEAAQAAVGGELAAETQNAATASDRLYDAPTPPFTERTIVSISDWVSRMI